MCATVLISRQELEETGILEKAQEADPSVQMSVGDVYPKAIIPVLDENQLARPMMWGFPLPGKKSVNFNARAETSSKLRMFRDAIPMIIPVSGFYEWQSRDGCKQRFLFRDPNEPLTYIAGLYKDFSGLDDGLYPYRFTMLTTEPSDSYRAYHHREPVVLHRDETEQWLHRDSAILTRVPFDLEAQAA